MSRIDRLGFVASAIAGRKVSVHASIDGDALAFSDGQAITVPTSLHDDDADHWLAVAAQAALIAAGSLSPTLLRQLIARPQTTQRYLYLEVLRASQLCQARLPWRFSELPEVRDAQPLTDSAIASLARACGSEPLPAPPPCFGTIKPLLALRRAVSEDGLAALTRQSPLGRLSQPVQQPIQQRDTKTLNDDEGEVSVLLKLFQNPFSANNALADMLNDILGAGIAKGRQAQKPDDAAGSEIPVGRIERSLRRGVDAVQAVLARLPFQMPEELMAESQSLVYPEWDTHAKAYRHDWVLVEEAEPWRADGAQDLTAVLLRPPPELRRQLGSLGLTHQMHRRQKEGADLDAEALIACAIELRARRSPPSLDVYRATRRTRRALAVAIVLDLSGSTGEQNAQGDSVFNKQLRMAYQLGLTLDALGNTVALFGFHSWGRKRVRVVRLKGHEERWSARVAERMAQLEPVGYTRTGTAIRHGTRLLCDRIGLPNRLLVLITDGIAYDQDYEDSYAEGDTRRALEEAKAAGTGCVCLSVGSGTETAKLTSVFGAANILATDDVAQVTTRIGAVCRQALRSGSSNRHRGPGHHARRAH